MARKQALPSDQLDRLNERYRRERDALVALTNARVAVEQAARRVDDATDALDQARHHEHDAYQDVVALVGVAAAAELAGGQPNGKASSRTRRAVPAAKATRRHRGGDRDRA